MDASPYSVSTKKLLLTALVVVGLVTDFSSFCDTFRSLGQ
jgi:hypothetical protein